MRQHHKNKLHSRRDYFVIVRGYKMGEKLDRFFKKAGEVFREFAPVLIEMLYAIKQAVERQQKEQEERERNRREARSVDINNRRAEMRGLPATLTVVEWLKPRHG